MNVLISGAGIAGPTLAYWLVQHGLQATIVEKAAALRIGGYVVDFWGAGFDVAERMGLLPEIRRRGYTVRERRVVDDAGKRVAGFGTSGWECPRIIDALDHAGELYFDRVSQIRLPAIAHSWSRQRVTLVGDAASCVSLLAGQGTALAITAAYLLAGELHRARGNHSVAFACYEDQFRPFVLEKQKLALRFAGAFAPKSTLAMVARNHDTSVEAFRHAGKWPHGMPEHSRITRARIKHTAVAASECPRRDADHPQVLCLLPIKPRSYVDKRR